MPAVFGIGPQVVLCSSPVTRQNRDCFLHHERDTWEIMSLSDFLENNNFNEGFES